MMGMDSELLTPVSTIPELITISWNFEPNIAEVKSG
jgi:hypothetical protein